MCFDKSIELVIIDFTVVNFVITCRVIKTARFFTTEVRTIGESEIGRGTSENILLKVIRHILFVY